MKNLKPVPADKKKSLGKLPTDVRNKMGYAQKGKMMSNRDKRQEEITKKQNPKSEYKKDKFGKTKLSYTEARKGKMIHKKGLGGLLSGLAKKVFGKKSDTAMPSTPVQVAMENGKIPLAKLYKQVTQKTTGAKYGKMMKAKKGVMVTGKKEEDKFSKYVKSIKLPDAKDVRDVVKNKAMGGEMKSTQGYGAARTSGMGLQDEDLIPGKSMDYYKDLM